jgi:membrane-associated protease RseP (regulator of RpoE activity)
MRKITLVLLVMVAVFTSSFAQIAGADCQNTCEVERVVQKGAFLGVQIQGMSCTSDYYGVSVKRVLPNTAAEKFNFQVKDIIVSVNGNDLYSTKELVELIASYEPSDVVNVLFKRSGKMQELDVVLGAKSTKIVKETICCHDSDTYFNDLNMSLYPNPAVNAVNFSMDNAEAGKYTFQVFNTIGAEVFVAVESFDAGFSRSIDLSDLSSGQYFVKVSKGNSSFTKTLFVAK